MTEQGPGRRDFPEAVDGGHVRRVCVVGSGWHFYSGISLYTCRLTNSLADTCATSAILMRRLLPRRLYPGAARVGRQVSTARYRDDVTVFDGVDYWGLPSLWRAVNFLRKVRPDVLVLQWWTGAVLHSYLVLALVARISGFRIVLEMHETQDTGEARHRLARWYVERGLRLLLLLTGAVVVHSEFDRARLRRYPAFRARPVHVIPHGPYDHLRAKTSALSQPEPPDRPDPGEFCYLYFGTIRPYKGVEYLIEAFNGLEAGEVAQRRLIVVGETWEKWERPAQLIEASPHRDRITFVNRYVHDTEVAAYFARADAVILPYLRSSASGPLHMAMSQGLPVAVSGVGGLVEAAREYRGTTFIRPGDVEGIRAALRSLPAHPRRRYPDPHDWSKNVAAFHKVFDLVTAGADPAPVRAGQPHTTVAATVVDEEPVEALAARRRNT
jgi:glycosyltransferase involved in cell wall biosynthesis